MKPKRFKEISRVWENFNRHEEKKIPYEVFRFISNEGLLHECDEDWQGKAMRLMRENPSLTIKELREWAVGKYREKLQARCEVCR